MVVSEKFVVERGILDKSIIKGYGHRTAPMLFEKKMADNEGTLRLFFGQDKLSWMPIKEPV